MGRICSELLEHRVLPRHEAAPLLSLFHIRTLAGLRIAVAYCIEVLVRQSSISTLAVLCQLFGNTAFHIRTAFVRHQMNSAIGAAF